MKISVKYTQLTEKTALRETFHNEKQVSVEAIGQKEIPFQVQRLMLMDVSKAREEPIVSSLVKYSPEEIQKLAEMEVEA